MSTIRGALGAPVVSGPRPAASVTPAAAQPTAPADSFNPVVAPPPPSTRELVTGPGKPVFDAAPSAIHTADALAKLISGPTGQSDEKKILALLTEAKSAEGGIPAVLFELKLHSLGLPDKLVRDVADRSLSDRFHRGLTSPFRPAGPSDEAKALWNLLEPGGEIPQDSKAALKALRGQAISLSSRENPDVQQYSAARLLRTDGPVKAFGVELGRLEPKPTATGQSLGDRTLKAALTQVDEGALGKLTNKLTGTYDPSTKAEISKVLASPKIPGASLGDLSVMVNGTFNMQPSAALVFRAAQHSGAVVLASSNPIGADGYRLRELTEVRGVPVPPELKGKIWGVGNMDPTFITWPQASDLLVEHLEVISTRFAAMKQANPELASLPSMRDAKTTVIGYSAGALSVVTARKRLEDAGQKGVIDQVVTIAGALGGSPFADTVDSKEDLEDPTRHSLAVKLGPAVGRMIQLLDPKLGRAMFEGTDPDAVASWRRELGLTPALVDLAYAASAEGGGSKVEPLFKLNAAVLGRVPGAPAGNDGMVYADPSAFAQRVVKDPEPKTHLLEWKDPATLDVVLRALATP